MRIDIDAIRKEIEQARNYEHDGCIVVRADSAVALLAEVERLRGSLECFIRVPFISLPLRVTGGGCADALLSPGSDTLIRFADGTRGLVISAERPSDPSESLREIYESRFLQTYHAMFCGRPDCLCAEARERLESLL